ncbi:hypothetical protein ACJIZ3_019658 [Penstemon smallii]|uniref:Uncharacterized protein n=1 Tax=Penstemon smallii TaxID=265156 RepID=A0ABD3T1R8_9LAMI
MIKSNYLFVLFLVGNLSFLSYKPTVLAAFKLKGPFNWINKCILLYGHLYLMVKLIKILHENEASVGHPPCHFSIEVTKLTAFPILEIFVSITSSVFNKGLFIIGFLSHNLKETIVGLLAIQQSVAEFIVLLSYTGRGYQVVTFAIFVNHQSAMEALLLMDGAKFDPQTGSTLHVKLARSNSTRKNKPGSGPYVVIERRTKSDTVARDSSSDGYSDSDDSAANSNYAISFYNIPGANETILLILCFPCNFSYCLIFHELLYWRSIIFHVFFNCKILMQINMLLKNVNPMFLWIGLLLKSTQSSQTLNRNTITYHLENVSAKKGEPSWWNYAATIQFLIYGLKKWKTMQFLQNLSLQKKQPQVTLRNLLSTPLQKISSRLMF